MNERDKMRYLARVSIIITGVAFWMLLCLTPATSGIVKWIAVVVGASGIICGIEMLYLVVVKRCDATVMDSCKQND